jgi:hypothetical protein
MKQSLYQKKQSTLFLTFFTFLSLAKKQKLSEKCAVENWIVASLVQET